MACQQPSTPPLTSHQKQGGEVFLFAHPGSEIPEGMLLLDACGAEVATNPTPIDATTNPTLVGTNPTPIDTC